MTAEMQVPADRLNENNARSGDKVHQTELHPSLRAGIEQHQEDSTAALREFLDNLQQNSEHKALIQKVILEEIRITAVRQGDPTVQTFEASQSTLMGASLAEISEYWMESYLRSHAEMRRRYEIGEVDAVTLFKVLLNNALLSAAAKATPGSSDAAKLQKAQQEAATYLQSGSTDFELMNLASKNERIGKDSRDLRGLVDKVIQEHQGARGPFMKEVDGYRFSIINDMAIVEIDITKDGKTIHLSLEHDGGVVLQMEGKDVASYTPESDHVTEASMRPDLLGPKLDLFVHLLKKMDTSRDQEVRDF